MKVNQRDQNPYKNTDSNKRYYTYDYYLRKVFGAKCAKIPLDAGFTCPNIDGKCGVGGCIYCSGRGSGDFAESPTLSLKEQFYITLLQDHTFVIPVSVFYKGKVFKRVFLLFKHFYNLCVPAFYILISKKCLVRILLPAAKIHFFIKRAH